VTDKPSLRRLRSATDALSKGVAAHAFAPPVALVYNPLEYAKAPHALYLDRYAANGKKRVFFLGMNPGPFGMAQTGVPFGEVSMVRDFLGIEAKVGHPPVEHAKRPVQGFACPRSEVSGSRLWGLFKERFETAEAFFKDHYVANYCPLVFLEEGGKNRTPDKLPRSERDALYAVCDAHLRALVDELEPEFVIGVGRFAEDRAKAALAGYDVTIGTVLHPSPASPKANQGWSRVATAELEALGVW